MPGSPPNYCDNKNILNIYQNDISWEKALGQLKLTWNMKGVARIFFQFFFLWQFQPHCSSKMAVVVLGHHLCEPHPEEEKHHMFWGLFRVNNFCRSTSPHPLGLIGPRCRHTTPEPIRITLANPSHSWNWEFGWLSLKYRGRWRMWRCLRKSQG